MRKFYAPLFHWTQRANPLQTSQPLAQQTFPRGDRNLEVRIRFERASKTRCQEKYPRKRTHHYFGKECTSRKRTQCEHYDPFFKKSWKGKRREGEEGDKNGKSSHAEQHKYCIQTLPRSGYGFASATRQLSYGWKTLGVQRCLLLRQSLRTDNTMIDEGRFFISIWADLRANRSVNFTLRFFTKHNERILPSSQPLV